MMKTGSGVVNILFLVFLIVNSVISEKGVINENESTQHKGRNQRHILSAFNELIAKGVEEAIKNDPDFKTKVIKIEIPHQVAESSLRREHYEIPVLEHPLPQKPAKIPSKAYVSQKNYDHPEGYKPAKAIEPIRKQNHLIEYPTIETFVPLRKNQGYGTIKQLNPPNLKVPVAQDYGIDTIIPAVEYGVPPPIPPKPAILPPAKGLTLNQAQVHSNDPCEGWIPLGRGNKKLSLPVPSHRHNSFASAFKQSSVGNHYSKGGAPIPKKFSRPTSFKPFSEVKAPQSIATGKPLSQLYGAPTPPKQNVVIHAQNVIVKGNKGYSPNPITKQAIKSLNPVLQLKLREAVLDRYPHLKGMFPDKNINMNLKYSFPRRPPHHNRRPGPGPHYRPRFPHRPTRPFLRPERPNFESHHHNPSLAMSGPHPPNPLILDPTPPPPPMNPNFDHPVLHLEPRPPPHDTEYSNSNNIKIIPSDKEFDSDPILPLSEPKSPPPKYLKSQANPKLRDYGSDVFYSANLKNVINIDQYYDQFKKNYRSLEKEHNVNGLHQPGYEGSSAYMLNQLGLDEFQVPKGLRPSIGMLRQVSASILKPIEVPGPTMWKPNSEFPSAYYEPDSTVLHTSEAKEPPRTSYPAMIFAGSDLGVPRSPYDLAPSSPNYEVDLGSELFRSAMKIAKTSAPSRLKRLLNKIPRIQFHLDKMRLFRHKNK